MNECMFCGEEFPLHKEDCLFMLDAPRRIEQLSENCRFLREKIDAVHKVLCPGLKGTWQDRAEQIVTVAKRVNPPSSLRQHLDSLIGTYWDLAYAEGKEGRDHDTEDGAAQRTLFEINTCLDLIQARTQGPKEGISNE